MVRQDLVHEALQNRTFSMKYCRSEHMLADIFTKDVQNGNFEINRTRLGVLKMRKDSDQEGILEIVL